MSTSLPTADTANLPAAGERASRRGPQLKADAAAIAQDSATSIWDRRRSQTLNAARRRSAFVAFMRLGLLVAIGAIILGVAGAIARQAVVRPALTDTLAATSVERMINPRFTGRDRRGDPYQITAQAAMRDPDSPMLTELETPRLDLLAGQALGSVVVSEIGVFDRDGRTLDLSGTVRLDTGNGYTFKTEAARVFVDENRVAGSVSVEGSGPIGTIRGDGFEILDGGARIRFNGGVVARINQEPKLAPPLTDGPD